MEAEWTVPFWRELGTCSNFLASMGCKIISSHCLVIFSGHKIHRILGDGLMMMIDGGRWKHLYRCWDNFISLAGIGTGMIYISLTCS